MDLDELFPDKPKDPLTELDQAGPRPAVDRRARRADRGAQGEIARVEAHMADAERHRSAAEELFKKIDSSR